MNDAKDIRNEFIAAAGDVTQTLGFGRNIGQIYAHVYFSRHPQSLNDLTDALGVSKGSASMSVRQLEQWGALKRVWIKGERRDHYQSTEEFGRIIRKALIDMIGRTMESSDMLLDESDAWLREKRRNGSADEDIAFLSERVEKLKKFRSRAQGLWDSPVIRLLFK